MNHFMTKKPLAWIVDSTAYITDTLKEHSDFFVIPLNIHFNEKQFIDGVDLTATQLYSKIKNAESFPKTSQPSAGEFAERYKTIAENYEQAIAIHVSSKLSGTLSTSANGAKIAGLPTTYIDSLSLSYGITGLIEKGMDMYDNGASVPEIKMQLDQMAGTMHNYILIGNLDQLYKGGRMGGIQFFLGSLLKIKPIVQISTEGELIAIEKVRSEKKALQYLIDKAKAGYDIGCRKFHIMHGNIVEQASYLKNVLLNELPGTEIVIGDISSTLAVHAGEGTLAVLWFD